MDMYLVQFFPPPPPFGYTNFRMYSIGELSSVLINGKQYCGKLYVNLANNSPLKINQMGMYFDDGSILTAQPTCTTIPSVIPQVQNNPAVFLDDTLNWMKIEGVFTANGTENRVTFGNFKTDAQTIGIATGFPAGLLPAYYGIDDLSLIALDVKAYAGSDVTICTTDSVSLGRPQEVGLECMWYTPNNATPFSTNSNFTFKSAQTGTYTFIQKMDNCQISFDTVTVTVIENCNTLIEIPNVFTPNSDGKNDTFYFSLPANSTNINFTIFNRWGNMIHSERSISSPSGRLGGAWTGRTTSGEECSDGVYFYVLQYTDAKDELIKKNGYITLIR